MIPKHLYEGDSGQEKLKSGIRKLSSAVKSTLGPEGNTVLIESHEVPGGYRVTKDGVTVAKSLNLYDPVENLAVEMMKQASARTAEIAGDGTTTSVVLTEAILNAADKHIKPEHSRIGVIRAIKKIEEQIVKDLDRKAVKVTGEKLVDVATVSANNDPVLGKLIADVYEKVKHVTVEDSPNEKTYSEIVEGLKIDRGFSSRFLITDEEKEEAVLNKPLILVSDVEINNLSKIAEILQYSNTINRPLLIIANMTQHAMAAMNLNVKAKKINVCHIQPPSMGWRKTDLLNDLSTVLGATFYSEDTGDNMEAISVEGLGEAEKIIVSSTKTVIVTKKGHRETETKDLIESLEKQQKDLIDPIKKSFAKERIANISGGVGVIYIGANSDLEQKEKYDSADDAVRAVSAAIDGGILPGGGIALRSSIFVAPRKTNEELIAEAIMHEVVQAPFHQILDNAGLNHKEVIFNIMDSFNLNYGLNVKTGKYGDMIEMGIVDPAKVTITALENAVSVASTIMNTQAIITNMRENDTQTTQRLSDVPERKVRRRIGFWDFVFRRG